MNFEKSALIRSTLIFTAVLVSAYIKPLLVTRAWSQIDSGITYPSALEITPWHVSAGGKDGFFVSYDLGQTWVLSGLNNRYVTDIKYSENRIFATTYYWQEGTNGLFVSQDKGQNWTHLGNNFSASFVDTDKKTIYLGGYSHGLWISKDNGLTWEQKLGDGWTGPQIIEIKSSENATYAAILTKVYKTTDNGETWEEVIGLRNKGIRNIGFVDKYIFASSSSPTGGLYRSENNGLTWDTVNQLNNRKVDDINCIENACYIGALLNPEETYSIYETRDFGNTWEDTELNINKTYSQAKDICYIYSKPQILITILPGMGIYRHSLEEKPVEFEQFLSLPWATNKKEDLIDKVYSYFDHEYPLLGYPYHKEPDESSRTTLNFWGIKGAQPDMYYSSHDGVDFALPYGTSIIAPAPGLASYYYCQACGNSIKIKHQNNYLTTYMHLQSSDLITTSSEGVWVNEGDIIGKVGMTGNTTGPHLHFSVLKDLNGNGIYEDDIPDGKIDPFSWLNAEVADPWPQYSWNDIKSTHSGQKSPYLWKHFINGVEKYFNNTSGVITLENKEIEVPAAPFEEGVTIFLKPYSTPQLPPEQKNLKYIPYTSFLLFAYDHMHNQVNNLTNKIKIKLKLSEEIVRGLLNDTIKLYYWNETLLFWDPLPLLIFNPYDYTLIAETEHLSHFAAFGMKSESTPPITTVNAEGTIEKGWFVTYPLVYMSTNTPEAKIFYSIGDEETWQEYLEPFEIQKEGIFALFYRSIDENGNIETTQTLLLKVDTHAIWKKDLKITNAEFIF